MSVNVRIEPLNIVDRRQPTWVLWICHHFSINFARDMVFTFITANKTKYLSTFKMKVHFKIHIFPISIYFDIMSKTMSACLLQSL